MIFVFKRVMLTLQQFENLPNLENYLKTLPNARILKFSNALRAQ